MLCRLDYIQDGTIPDTLDTAASHRMADHSVSLYVMQGVVSLVFCHGTVALCLVELLNFFGGLSIFD